MESYLSRLIVTHFQFKPLSGEFKIRDYTYDTQTVLAKFHGLENQLDLIHSPVKLPFNDYHSIVVNPYGCFVECTREQLVQLMHPVSMERLSDVYQAEHGQATYLDFHYGNEPDNFAYRVLDDHPNLLMRKELFYIDASQFI